jgi:hypothetical protein
MRALDFFRPIATVQATRLEAAREKPNRQSPSIKIAREPRGVGRLQDLKPSPCHFFALARSRLVNALGADFSRNADPIPNWRRGDYST